MNKMFRPVGCNSFFAIYNMNGGERKWIVFAKRIFTDNQLDPEDETGIRERLTHGEN
jgi:hypothetical protein